jgi:hypothetical protein
VRPLRTKAIPAKATFHERQGHAKDPQDEGAQSACIRFGEYRSTRRHASLAPVVVGVQTFWQGGSSGGWGVERLGVAPLLEEPDPLSRTPVLR